MDDIPGWPGYHATTDGQIISTKGRIPRILKPTRTNYDRVSLRKDGRTFTRSVHALIALTYLGPKPEGMEVRHIDGDSFNNARTNLGYATHSENQQDQLVHGTNKEARKTRCKNGHDFSVENTYWRTNKTTGKKFRQCRECIRKSVREHMRRRRAAARQATAKHMDRRS